MRSAHLAAGRRVVRYKRSVEPNGIRPRNGCNRFAGNTVDARRRGRGARHSRFAGDRPTAQLPVKRANRGRPRLRVDLPGGGRREGQTVQGRETSSQSRYVGCGNPDTHEFDLGRRYFKYVRPYRRDGLVRGVKGEGRHGGR